MFKLEQIHQTYPTFQLEDISMEIPKGYIIGMLGENGAGKSTLLKIMLGYQKPDSGKVFLDGQELWASEQNQKDVKNQLGFVLNEELFSSYNTLLDNGLRYGKYYSRYDHSKLQQHLQEFQLEGNRKYGKLSQGEKLKFQFAFALAHEPKVLLLDEPLGSFDMAFREKFLKHLTSFVEDGEHSVILVSHLTQELDQIADYIALIHKGKLMDFSDIEDLREQYRLISGEKSKIDLLQEDSVVYREEGTYSTKALVKHSSVSTYDKEVEAEVPTLEDIFYYRIKGEQ